MDWRNKEWYNLIESFAKAQELMGWQKTIHIKERLLGERPKVNQLSVMDLRKLVAKLRKVWHESQEGVKDDPKAE
jgi:hypothetical protein